MFNLNTLPRSMERSYIDKLIASGVVKVTRCPDAAYEGDGGLRAKRGGALPPDMDPRRYTIDCDEATSHTAPNVDAAKRPSRKIRRFL